jgi:NADH dehydrogenase FAD-containing subunit
VLSLRPLAGLRQAWPAWLARWAADADTTPSRITAVGGGAAGVETLLAVLARLRALRPDRPVRGRLVSRATTLLAGYAPGAVRAAQRALARADVTCLLGTDWHDGLAAPGERLLWATGAQAHDWQRDPARRGGLAVGDEGFIRIDRHLRSLSHPQVFAVGDCAEWAPALPKSGVHAVRMGPVLLDNLRAALGHGSARPWQPQPRTLALLATADGRAIASRGGWSAEGRWVMHWKHWLDTRFVRGAA